MVVNNGDLPIMETFYSLQGEGYHHGKAAYFIRLGGCDVGCVWCDVKESWRDDHPMMMVSEIVKEASEFPSRLAIITGGEPLMHPLDELTSALKDAGFATHLETAGAHEFSGTWDWVCLSPKKFKAPVIENLKKADELKVIIYNRSDFDWAISFQNKVSGNCKFYLQPEWSKQKEIIPDIVDFIKMYPHWEISLQTHKFMNIP